MCHKCPNFCSRSICEEPDCTSFGKKMGSPGGQSQSCSSPQRRLHLPVPAKFDQITHHHELLYKFPGESLPGGGIASAFEQNCSGTDNNSRVKSLEFNNRLFLVPKPNNRWRPILDLSTLNKFLKTESFITETPETIRTSLQAGEWDFHILIQSQSRKYMRFHIQGQSHQFKVLPFGLSTAPMEFTVVVKMVNYWHCRGV